MQRHGNVLALLLAHEASPLHALPAIFLMASSAHSVAMDQSENDTLVQQANRGDPAASTPSA